MNLLNTIFIGLKEIWAHKFRSLLTMLGIILGVASLVGMAAIIKGMENGMKEAMVAMGGVDKVLLRSQPVPAWQDHLADQAPGRTMADVLALERQFYEQRVLDADERHKTNYEKERSDYEKERQFYEKRVLDADERHKTSYETERQFYESRIIELATKYRLPGVSA